MKILLVHNLYQYAGGEDEVFRRERQLLVQRGHTIIEYVRDNREISEYQLIEKATLALRTTWAWDTRRELGEILKGAKPDLAHFHNTFPLVSPAAYHTCNAQGVPVVQTLHNYRFLCPAGNFLRNSSPCEDCVEKNLLHSVRHGCFRQSKLATSAVALMLAVHRRLQTYTRLVDKYITPSEFARAKFVKSGIAPAKIAVKPNFVDLDPGPGGHFSDYALFVGRLAPEKGLHTLLRAWKFFTDKALHIVGDGVLQGELKAAAIEFGLVKTSFLGRLQQSDVYSQMRNARVLVFPSECYETFGTTIVEAYACGLPVIVSRLGAGAELVKDGITGLLFSAADATDLAAKVAWAWSHPEEMRVMGHNARAEYEAKYTSEKNYAILSKIYQSVVLPRSVDSLSQSLPVEARL